MKIYRQLLKLNTETTFKEDIDFSNINFDSSHIKAIKSCCVTASAIDFGNIINISIKIVAKVVTTCSYTLEDMDYIVKTKECISFSDNIDDCDDVNIIYEKSNEIDLDEYIFSYIVTSVPFNLKKPGAEQELKNKGINILTEEEYLKEKEKRKESSVFNALDDLEL